jgi:hypothetical protein
LKADHGKLKRLINPLRGFQLKTAYATIKGFEIMHVQEGQFNIWMYDARIEVSFINEQFGLVEICPKLNEFNSTHPSKHLMFS